MALFDNLRQRIADYVRPQPSHETRATISAPDAALLGLFAALPASSGVTVSPQNAMRCTAVRRAVGAIAETVGTLPCLIYERDASGAHKPAESHAAYSLLHRDANPWTPSSRAIEQLVRDACLWGNGYQWANRVNGEPRELVRLRPETVSVTYHVETGEPLYHVANGEDQRDIPREDVIHLMAPSIDGIVGESPVIACREAIGLCLIMESHAARLFGKGSRPSGILSTEKSLGEATLKRLAASWAALNSGDSAGSAAILEEGMKWQALAFSSVDSQFLQLWQNSINEIARAFGVPPHLLFEMGRATWGNAAELGSSFLRFTLSRWLTALEGEFALKLIASQDRDRFCIEFDTDTLLRADLAARADAYQKLIAARVINPNEARRWENLAPYDGGDQFINPNTTPNAGAFNA